MSKKQLHSFFIIILLLFVGNLLYGTFELNKYIHTTVPNHSNEGFCVNLGKDALLYYFEICSKKIAFSEVGFLITLPLLGFIYGLIIKNRRHFVKYFMDVILILLTWLLLIETVSIIVKIPLVFFNPLENHHWLSYGYLANQRGWQIVTIFFVILSIIAIFIGILTRLVIAIRVFKLGLMTSRKS